MSISVSFYNNLSDNRYLTKNLTQIAENITCDIYNPTEIIDPTLLIDIDVVDFAIVNYCIIAGFNRKYFITNVSPVSGKRLAVQCHVDVLGTYDEELRQCPLIAARSSNQPNYYLQDDMRIFNTYTYNQYIDIGTDIGAPSQLVIITI